MLLRLRAALAALLVLGAALAAAAPRPAEQVHWSAPHAVMRTAPYGFSSVLDGRPVRWDPCTPIHWVSSTVAGPPGGLAVLRAAVAEVSRVTGTTWVYDGAVRSAPTSAWLPTSSTQRRPVLLGWADARSSDLLRGAPPSVLGMARTAWWGQRYSDGSQRAATRAAVVAFDRADRLPLRGPMSWSAVALHELGHVMGLSHAPDARQLMAAVLPQGAETYQRGDIAGLSALGRRAGCVDLT